MVYPNVGFWGALKSGVNVTVEGNEFRLSTVDCGELALPSGELVACDPFSCLSRDGNRTVNVPRGKYPVTVTMADVSDARDGSHLREAYVTLLLDEAAPEVRRSIITPSDEQVPPEIGLDGSYHGFPVDAGTACFVDNQAVRRCMPDSSDWYNDVFDNESAGSWFNRMDDPDHIRDGIANIELPLASEGENIVIVHSGWGDGNYPVVGGYDSVGNLVRVHIDFLVVFNDTE